jgi:anti-sigma factor RsiW
MEESLPVTESDLQAYADGRLPASRVAEIQAWLASRPEEHERLEAYQLMGAELRKLYDPVLAEPVPERLERTVKRRKRWHAAALAAAWVALGVAIGTLAGWQLRDARTASTAMATQGAAMAHRAAIAHVVYSPEVRHPVEVGADQEDHLVAWLSKRLGVKVKAPRLADAGMSLVGGRLLPGEAGPVAQFMYQTDKGRRMTLYVRAESSQHPESAFRYARDNNVGVFYWIDHDCGYAIASADLNRDELLHIATLVYKQLEP